MGIPRLASRLTLAVTATTAVTAAVVGGAGAASASTPVYAALGDSYSSGVGTNDYTADSGSCDRSPQSYAQLWATAHGVTSFDFAACSGATTTDVLNNQLGGLSAATTLVSITIGGNDVGFATVMTDCNLSSDAACLAEIQSAENSARTTLPAKLDATYAAIRQHAPNAGVVVLDYPHLFETGSCVTTLDATKRTALNQAADVLDGVVRTEVGKAGFTFADARGRFAGHGVCGSTAWINDLTWPVTDSYHPKAAGYRNGYLPTLTAATG
jgi:lysophospholipase L1-like esterase